jgi:hypothetical protein
MAGLNDTHPEAEQAQIEIYRKMSFDEKWRLMDELHRNARLSHAQEYRRRNPSATEEMIQDDWRMISLGPELYEEVKEAMTKRKAGEKSV